MSNIFLSHRGADSVLAERLANEIRAAGHEVWLGTWTIKTGDQIVERISGGLESADYVVVCYSSIGMAPWMTIEWASALAAQLNGNRIKVLPVRLSGTNVPGILIGTRYADLTRDWNKGIQELLDSIKQR